jgi:hypothetical protein
VKRLQPALDVNVRDQLRLYTNSDCTADITVRRRRAEHRVIVKLSGDKNLPTCHTQAELFRAFVEVIVFGDSKTNQVA